MKHLSKRLGGASVIHGVWNTARQSHAIHIDVPEAARQVERFAAQWINGIFTIHPCQDGIATHAVSKHCIEVLRVVRKATHIVVSRQRALHRLAHHLCE